MIKRLMDRMNFSYSKLKSFIWAPFDKLRAGSAAPDFFNHNGHNVFFTMDTRAFASFSF